MDESTRAWLRWKIARLIDRLWPDSCWADVASWALKTENPCFWDGLSLTSGQRCREFRDGDLPACWCGKFRDIKGVEKFHARLDAVDRLREAGDVGGV